MQYDPDTDASSVKKGKEIVYRYDGAGVETVEDPRKSTSAEVTTALAKARARSKLPLATFSYAVS